MSKFTKEEKYELIKNTAEHYGITAYEIAKNTNLTEAGILNILSGRSKRPHESTLDSILQYFSSLEPRKPSENAKGLINEPKQTYGNEVTLEEIKNMIILVHNNLDNVTKGVSKTIDNTKELLENSKLQTSGMEELLKRI